MQVVATVALMALLVGAGPPSGDATLAEAKAHAEAAKKAFMARKFNVALQEFQAAQRLKPAPGLWFNIGKCYEKLNEAPSALRAYRTYLNEAPTTPDKKEVDKAIGRMELKLRAKGVQQLMVISQTPGATASITGKGSLPTPATWELRPGTYTVTVSASGYQTSSKPVTVTAKKSVQVAVALEQSASPRTTPPPEIASSSPVEEGPAPLLQPRLPLEPLTEGDQGKVTVAVRPNAPPPPAADAPVQVLSEPRRPLALSPPPPASGKRWTWVASGVSLVGVGAGVGFGLSANSASADLRNGTLRTQAEATQLYTRARSSALYANIGYGAAAAAGVTAIVLFLVEGQSSSF